MLIIELCHDRSCRSFNSVKILDHGVSSANDDSERPIDHIEESSWVRHANN